MLSREICCCEPRKPGTENNRRNIIPDKAWCVRRSSWRGYHLIVSKLQLSFGCMAAYSLDLRQKILGARERRLGSPLAIADVFGVSPPFVEKGLRQHRTTGDMAPKPHAGGQEPRLSVAAQAVIERLVRDHPDAALAELCAGVAAEMGVQVSMPTMCHVLQRMGLPRNKSCSTPRSATRRGSSRRGRTTERGSSHSSPAGRSSSPCGAPSRPGLVNPSERPSGTPGQRSHRRMHAAGSVVAAMPYNSSKIAL
jgi:transposase